MSKINQIGAIEVSTIAGIVIVATIVGAVSIIATSKYYEGAKIAQPVAVITPEITPLIATPTSTPVVDEKTAGWQTYTNEKYGFEIKHPENIEKYPRTSGVDFSEESIAQNTFFSINVYSTLKNLPNNSSGLGFEKWIDEQIKNKTFEDKKSFNNGTIKGFEVTDQGITTFRNILVQNNNNVYSFIIRKNSNLMNLFDQMLSTFKFTEKSIVGNDQASAKIFCQSLVGPGLKLGTFEYFSNDKNEKFADCGIGDDQGGTHIIAKYISNSWAKIWSGNGDISQADITKYNIPKEIYDRGSDQTATWKTISNTAEGYELKYPTDLDLGSGVAPEVIINYQGWSGSIGTIANKGNVTINSIQYNLNTRTEGAAGSTYVNYAYKTERNGKTYTIYFEVKYATDCKTYAASADQAKCEAFKASLNGKIEKIVATFKFTK